MIYELNFFLKHFLEIFQYNLLKFEFDRGI